MQYILTQEEMDSFNSRIPVRDVSELKTTIDDMRKIIANTHGCIYIKKENRPWYCDDCVLNSINKACTLPKEFSR